MTEAATFTEGTPTTPDGPLYWCDWNFRAFTGDLSKHPTCPYCNRTGEGVYRINQKYVERRFQEKLDHTAIEDEYRHAKPEARMQKHHEVSAKYQEVTAMAKNKAATAAKPKAEKKPKEKHPCACGCDTLTGGTWAPGHDAKFYSAIRKRNAGDLTVTEVSKMFPKATIEEFEKNVH